mgnify:CR=1 FL=1
MKNKLFLLFALMMAFSLGYAFNEFIGKTGTIQPLTKKVTGIGSIFFKCKDPKKVRVWYASHLGLNTNEYGAVFEWRQGADTSRKGFSQWSSLSEKT